MQNNPGNVIIVAAPSGGGKTSLVNQLVQVMSDIEISVSHTTRAKRPGEVEGEDYFYLSELAFLDKINQGDFIEYAKVFNHYYGTSAVQISERLAKGSDVVLDIDWQGAMQIKKVFPDALSIFIIPPSLDALETRLLNRNQDNLAVIEARMQQAKAEMSHYSEFDYVIVNDKFDIAAKELQTIVYSARLKLAYQCQKHRKLLSLLLT